MSEAAESKVSVRWLVFFFICYVLIMAIGGFAIFNYHCNEPEAAPAAGGHH
jgi:hypothetical protein